MNLPNHHESDDAVVCPYCEHEHDEEADVYDVPCFPTRRLCNRCGQQFLLWTETTVTYVTREL